MLNDIRVAASWWTAKLADGSEWCDLSPELQDLAQSPWLSLEARGLAVVEASLQWGKWRLTQEAHGDRLVCGSALDLLMDMGGGPRNAEFRFILRENPVQWIWTITDGCRWWEVVEPPGVAGCEQMPSVAGLEPKA